MRKNVLTSLIKILVASSGLGKNLFREILTRDLYHLGQMIVIDHLGLAWSWMKKHMSCEKLKSLRWHEHF